MRGVSIERVSGGAILTYWSDNLPRVKAVYTTFDLALEAATAWLGGEREVTRGHGRPVTLGDPLGGGIEFAPRVRGVIGTPFDDPENPVPWERDE
jgi:hypothetical protein